MNKVLFKIDNVGKSFNGRVILKDINFEINEGKIIGFLGFSGSGKTTLLNMISGFYRPDKGKILYNTSKRPKEENFKTILKMGDKLKSIIGFSTQNTSFYSELTVYENLEYFAHLYDIKKSEQNERIMKILKKLDLEDYHKSLAKNLSEGMKKRLDLACSLIHDPKVLILDEPTVNLDFKLKEEFLYYIKRINKLGVTVLFVSHLLDELTELCDYILMINQTSKFITEKKDIKRQFNEFARERK